MAHICNISRHISNFTLSFLAHNTNPFSKEMVLLKMFPPLFSKPLRVWRSSVMDSHLGTLKVHRCRCHCRYSSKSWFPLLGAAAFFQGQNGQNGVDKRWKANVESTQEYQLREAIAIGLHRWKKCGSQNSVQNKNKYATSLNCSNGSWLNVIVCQGGEVQNKSFNHLKH